jgi:hypothetical protein
MLYSNNNSNNSKNNNNNSKILCDSYNPELFNCIKIPISHPTCGAFLGFLRSGRWFPSTGGVASGACLWSVMAQQSST